MMRPRTAEPDMNDPRGQFGTFLRSWIDKHGDINTIAEHMGVTPRAVGKWCEGVAAPSLADFDKLAKFLGYADWSKLAVAVVRFSAKHEK